MLNSNTQPPNATYAHFLKRIHIYISKKKFITSKKYSIASLNKILLHCTESEIISFDFFDTLVHRIVAPPDRVKLKTAEYASIQLKQLGYDITAEEFNKIRNREETKLRDNNFYKKGKDRETDIFSIIEQTLVNITEKKINSLILKIIDYEVMNEINHLYLNDEVKNILKALKNKGKKIIICSDMYLSEEHIKQIVNNLGILNYVDKFYVSATKKITKGSDRLFQFILQDINLSPKKFLHVGDNFISDYLSPRKLGIKAIHYHNREILKKYKKINRSLEQINYTKKLINKKFINNFISLKDYKKDDYQEISRHISPVLALFAYQTLLDMYLRGIRTIFFFAREGILLKKIFNEILDNVLLFQSEKHTFKLEVLYISRLSSSCAIYTGIKNIDSLIETIQYATGSLSINSLLQTYGLSTTHFSENALKKVEPYFYNSNKDNLITLLTYTSFGEEFEKLLKNKKDLIKQYLSEQGVLNKGKIGLVDLGWGGTIQKNISHFLPEYPFTEFFGYYFGTNSSIFDKNSRAWDRSTFFPGYIISYQDDYKIEKFNATVSFIESICGYDAIGTTIGYKSNPDGTITPLLENNIKKNSYNLYFQKNIADNLHRNIKEFSQLFNIASIPIEKLKSYSTQQFLEFIFKPKRINLKKIQDFKFNNNWSNLENSLITPIKFSDIFKPVTLLNKIRNSPWRYGTIAAAPIPFLLAIYNLGYYCLRVYRYLVR